MLIPRQISSHSISVVLIAFITIAIQSPFASAASWQSHAPLPEPLANNAVAIHNDGDTSYVYSFMGIDTTKVWSGITKHAWRLNVETDSWEALPDVPGSAGRIAALAFECDEKIYLMGGYSVNVNQAETTWDAVDIYDPVTNSWSAGAPIPVPVDDMVGGVWRDSLIYLVCGWSQSGNVQNTQVYNPTDDSWAQATPFPIEGTFGGAGGIVGNWIVYADGVKGNFLMRRRVHRGWIDPANPLSVTWGGTGGHPGPGLYRMASGNVPGDSTAMLFAGGSDNPYNFDGEGYNNQPSEPTAQMWLFYPESSAKLQIGDKNIATMDHRGFPSTASRMFIVGGMIAGRQVTDIVQSYIADLPTGLGAELLPPEPGGGVWALQAIPNPARESVAIFAEAKDRGRTLLRNAAVYDLRGRLVRRFNNSTLAASAGFEWDLRDDRGNRVPSGIYLLRGDLFDRHISRKITVVD